MQSTLTEQQTLVKRIRDGYQSNQPYVITPEDDLILNDVYSSLAALRWNMHDVKKKKK